MDDDTAPNTPAFHALILDTLDSGFDGIEFNWRTPDLFNLVNYARSFGLGVGLWTVPERMKLGACYARHRCLNMDPTSVTVVRSPRKNSAGLLEHRRHDR